MIPPPDPDAVPQRAAPVKTGYPLRSLLIALGVFIGLPLVGLAFLWRGRCTDSLLSTLVSPDAAAQVETHVKDCGPAMKPATIVRVVELHAGKAGDSSDVLVVHGKVDVETRWEAAQVLALALPKDAVVVSRRQSWRDLQVKLK